MLTFVENYSCPFNSWNLRECLRRVLLFYVVSDTIAVSLSHLTALPHLWSKETASFSGMLSSLFSEFKDTQKKSKRQTAKIITFYTGVWVQRASDFKTIQLNWLLLGCCWKQFKNLKCYQCSHFLSVEEMRTLGSSCSQQQPSFCTKWCDHPCKAMCSKGVLI